MSSFGQNSDNDAISNKAFSSAKHYADIGLYGSKFNSKFDTETMERKKTSWYGLGFYLGGGVFGVNNYSFFFDLGLDCGGSKDIFELNLPLAVNAGYNVFSDTEKQIYTMLHLGFGYFYSSLRTFSTGYLGGYYLFDNEHLEQHSAFAPFGLRFYYKNFFMDVSYRFRFWKSGIKISENEELDYILDDYDYDYLPYKRQKNNSNIDSDKRLKDIEVFKWVFTIGFNI